MNQLALFLQGQHAARVGERMDHDGGVLPCFDDLVQIADGAVTHGERERPVLPLRPARIQQMTAHQVRARHVFVARDGDEGLAELPCHVLDEAGLAAAGGPLQHHGHAHAVGSLVKRHLAAGGQIIRLLADQVLADEIIGEVDGP